MTRTLVVIILATAILAVVFYALCQVFFPDVLPYAVGESEAVSWQRQIAFLLKALAWISAELSGLLMIVLAARVWKQRSVRAS